MANGLDQGRIRNATRRGQACCARHGCWMQLGAAGRLERKTGGQAMPQGEENRARRFQGFRDKDAGRGACEQAVRETEAGCRDPIRQIEDFGEPGDRRRGRCPAEDGDGARGGVDVACFVGERKLQRLEMRRGELDKKRKNPQKARRRVMQNAKMGQMQKRTRRLERWKRA